TDAEKLDATPTRESGSGAAILTEALAYFDCEVVATDTYGDHNVYIGKVVEAEILNDGEPLTTLDGMKYSK
ncbi:MAG: flavin reductase family protein, partial [Candidatus Latescibacterota bacterium]